MLADPKPAKRIRDKAAVSRFWNGNTHCEVCRFGVATSPPHHVLFKSQGGDDVSGDLLSVCVVCHRRFHDGDDVTRQAFGMAVRRRVDVLDYLDAKLGSEGAQAFLERVYPL